MAHDRRSERRNRTQRAVREVQVERSREDLPRLVARTVASEATLEGAAERLRAAYINGMLNAADLGVVERMLEGMSGELTPLEAAPGAPRLATDRGEPLAAEVRARIEPVLGQDLGAVRVHTGPDAADLAGAFGARALASGLDVFVRDQADARNAPLMAHEVTHVAARMPAVALDKGDEAPGKESAPDASRDSQSAEDKPPHKFEKLGDGGHRLSDAVIGDFKAAAREVKDLTGVDIAVGLGDSTRNLSSGTNKVGADNFSWHKTGRAVDLNQGLKWVIAKDPADKKMFFRLYLAYKEPEKTHAQPDAGKDPKAPDPFVTLGKDTEFQHNPYGRKATTMKLVDVTAILERHGFTRIPAHTGWEQSYNKLEWWHYNKLDGLTWYAAVRQVYTEDEFVSAMKTLTGGNEKLRARLEAEGTPAAVLDKIFPQKPAGKSGR